jgi:hypothetical protein
MAENDDRTSRRNLLIGASCALICAPAIVKVANIMPVRRLVVPAQPNYYGFTDRLWIDQLYRSGQLKGKALI